MLIAIDDRFVHVWADEHRAGLVLLLKNGESKVTTRYLGGRPIGEEIPPHWGPEGGRLQLVPAREGSNRWEITRPGWPILTVELGKFNDDPTWQAWFSSEGSYTYGYYLPEFDPTWVWSAPSKGPTFWERILG